MRGPGGPSQGNAGKMGDRPENGTIPQDLAPLLRPGCPAKPLSAIGRLKVFCPLARGPMSVDATTVRRIAHLARVAVADDEVEHLRGELNAILAFVDQLAEVDVTDVEPMTSVTPMAMKKRADEVTDGGNADDIGKNAPAREDHFFAVPKVVE